MGKKIRKHIRTVFLVNPPALKEALHKQKGNVPLSVTQADRISFSVLRNENNKLRKIENISYEIYVQDNWEWIVRYDDHGGNGCLHRHFRVSLKDESIIESNAGIKKYNNKDHELTWVCKDIKRNYLIYRSKFLGNMGLDLY
jgi:hypothetical protein